MCSFMLNRCNLIKGLNEKREDKKNRFKKERGGEKRSACLMLQGGPDSKYIYNFVLICLYDI